MAHFRDRRAFGSVGTRRFRGARYGDRKSPRFQGLLDLYPGAAAAYSLQALSSSWVAGDVVEVRRSSDGSLDSFTQGQIDSGAMLDWVKRPGDFTNVGFETFANNGTGDGFTATNSAGVGVAKSSAVDGIVTDVVTITFDIDIVSGSPSISLRLGGGEPQDLQTITTNGSKSITLTATGAFDNFTFSDGDLPSEFTVSNVRVSTNDGYVSRLYDQSGFGNDATQAVTTSQPKIVDAGALVAGGLDFDGVDDGLGSIPNLFSGTSAASSFIVGNADTAGINEAMFSQGANNILGNAFVITSEIAFRPGGNTIYNDDFINANPLLLSTIAPASSTSADVSMFLDGSPLGQISTTSTVLNYGIEGAAIGQNLFNAVFYNGRLKEIIIYPSDQSANRIGIETNINNRYNIFIPLDAWDDSKSWDDSGTWND